MARTSSNPTPEEVVREYLKGRKLSGSGRATYVGPEDAALWAREIAERLPKSTNVKAWVGYGPDRKAVLFTGKSKAEIKEKWEASIGVTDAKRQVRVVFTASGVYRYSFTAADFSTHDIWIVEAGMEGFGA